MSFKRLNEGLLSEEQRRAPLERIHAIHWAGLNEGLLSEEQRHEFCVCKTWTGPASTKGCSQRSSDLPRPARYRATQSPPQRRAALRGAATIQRLLRARGCRPQRRAALRGAATELSPGACAPSRRPQRRAALRGAATLGVHRNRGSRRRASTKGCSQRSSDAAVSASPVAFWPASTKGCSQRSSDQIGLYLLGPRDGRLNEGLLSEEQRLAGAVATTELCSASTKGCSQRSSDLIGDDVASPELKPQRRAALRGAATQGTRGVGASPAQSLNEGLLSEEQRPQPLWASLTLDPASTKGCSQRSSDSPAATTSRAAPCCLNEGLLSEEQRPTATCQRSRN